MKKFKKLAINEYAWLVILFVLFLVLYSLCRILFYWFNISLFPEVTFSSFLTLMKGGLKFDISAFFFINAIFLLLAIFPQPFRFGKPFQTFLRWLFIVINSVGLALNVIDFIYYPFILKRTTASVADILSNETNLTGLFARFLFDYWYAFLIWLCLVSILILTLQCIQPKPLSFKSKWVQYPIGLAALVLVMVFAIGGARGGYRHSTRPITLSNAGDYVQSPEQTAIVLNTPFCIIRTYGKKTFEHKDYFADEETLVRHFNPEFVPSDTTPMQHKNVVILILESFSREHSGFFNPHLDSGKYKGYTPFLDSIAAQSLVFPNAFANGRKSIDALPSVIASIPALVLPYVVSEYSSNRINSLANLLAPEGYTSAFFHGAPNGSMGFSAFSKMAGFNHYYGKTEYNNNEHFDGIWGIWDEEFLQFFAQEMNKMKQPFFTSMFTLSSHHPYEVPIRYKGVFPKGNMPLHQCIGYTDNALRLFFQTISNESWFNNTLFVLTADHGITAWHNEYKTNMNVFAVPIIFYTPDGSLKGIDNRPAQQTDIMPTILSFLNFPKPYIAFGNNLLTTDSDRYVVNYVGDHYQFMMDSTIIYYNGKKINPVYNWKNDPLLQHNLADQIDVSALEIKLKAFLQQYNNRMISNRLTIKE